MSVHATPLQGRVAAACRFSMNVNPKRRRAGTTSSSNAHGIRRDTQHHGAKVKQRHEDPYSLTRQRGPTTLSHTNAVLKRFETIRAMRKLNGGVQHPQPANE